MAQEIATDDQSDEINLAEMPIEILEHILIHLDDDYHYINDGKNLLTASHVCKSFAAGR